jgi:hypothetical protein
MGILLLLSVDRCGGGLSREEVCSGLQRCALKTADEDVLVIVRTMARYSLSHPDHLGHPVPPGPTGFPLLSMPSRSYSVHIAWHGVALCMQ